MAELIPSLRFREYDANGDPLAGGMVYSYLAGTVTPASTYADRDETTPNANPVVLDANGAADIYLATGTVYKLIVTDADDVVQYTVDNVMVLKTVAAGDGTFVEHVVTDGQSATNLVGETLDLSTYSSALYDVEIIRGTTVIANGQLAIQSANGTGRVCVGQFISEEPHGVTFSVSQASTVVQLKAALNSGAGNGTIKLIRKLVSV